MFGIKRRVHQAYNLGKFFFRQRVIGFAVPTEPEFDEPSKRVFIDLLVKSSFYLEYGSGGSTLLAARNKKRFISVDTDWWFLRSVRKAIGKLSANQQLIHANIGLTGPWGKPLRATRLSANRLAQWRSYSGTPWESITDGDAPDLVLVDGRFRVSTTLFCCQKLANRPDARILVDDYVGRSEYSVIERHADLIGMAGRMAIFKPRSTYDASLQEAVTQHATAWE